jgi:hypothetical protein
MLQQSIDHALQAQRFESEEQLRVTAEFISPKWPHLRAEISKVMSKRGGRWIRLLVQPCCCPLIS